MGTLDIHLFGKRSFEYNGQPLEGLDVRKVQELLCYLLLYPERPHARETLAGVLWEECSTAQSKTYLRKTIWQLQLALESQLEAGATPVLLVDAEWVQLNSQADIRLDVTRFEQAFAPVQGLPGEQLTSAQAAALQEAVALYHTDLLEGWYQEWCLYRREQLQQIYLSMVDKLMGYCEQHQDYTASLAYGTTILRYDRAREHTHRRLIRLHFLAGDRTEALRQYERCVAALREELDACPTGTTTALYDQIRLNQWPNQVPVPTHFSGIVAPPLAEVLGRLKQLHAVLQDVQYQMQHEIRVIEGALDPRPD